MRLPDPEHSRVVLIGTSTYEGEKLPDLPAVGRDIEDLKAALTGSVYGLIPEDHCDVLEDEGDIRLIGRRLRRAASQAEDPQRMSGSGERAAIPGLGLDPILWSELWAATCGCCRLGWRKCSQLKNTGRQGR